MKTQIVALTTTGFNMLWDSEKRDFVAYEKEVPETDNEDFEIAKKAADGLPGIEFIWEEQFDDNGVATITQKHAK